MTAAALFAVTNLVALALVTAGVWMCVGPGPALTVAGGLLLAGNFLQAYLLRAVR